VVFYESRKLNEHKQNNWTHVLELEAIRHYLLGRRFVLMSDHSGMIYLFDQPNMNSR